MAFAGVGLFSLGVYAIRAPPHAVSVVLAMRVVYLPCD